MAPGAGMSSFQAVPAAALHFTCSRNEPLVVRIELTTAGLAEGSVESGAPSASVIVRSRSAAPAQLNVACTGAGGTKVANVMAHQSWSFAPSHAPARWIVDQLRMTSVAIPDASAPHWLHRPLGPTV